MTSPVQTLIDLAGMGGPTAAAKRVHGRKSAHPRPRRRTREEMERAVSEADKLGLVNPPRLRAALDEHRGEPGVGRLRGLLDRRTFRLTRSRLERLFLPLVDRAGLPRPLTKQWVNGFEVDFFWPELGLLVETDGLTYHRTPAAQAVDRVRDQTHTAAGLTPLRFTHEQVRFEPEHVLAVLGTVADMLAARGTLPRA